MALKNIRNYLSVVERNKGVLKTDQLELVSQSSAPTSSLSDGRLYENSTDDVWYGRTGSTWVAFNGYRSQQITVTNLATTTTLTAAQAGLINVTNAGNSVKITLPSTADTTIKGLTFTIKKRDAAAEAVVIATDGTDAMDTDNATQVSDMDAQGDVYTFVADGVGTWYITQRYLH